MRSLLLAASMILSCGAWSQAAEPDAGHQAEIAKFRARLAADVRRFRGQYPPAAREQGLEGTAIITVAVDAEGRRTCTLKRSSGHEILDEKALAVARYAVSNVPMPEGLRGVPFSTEIRLQFALRPPPKRATERARFALPPAAVGNSHKGGLDPKVADFLQQVAADTVKEYFGREL